MSSGIVSTLENLIDHTRNWKQQRRYEPSLWKRTAGFTETFGMTETNDRISKCWRAEQESIEILCATEYPSTRIRLFQYRPAWVEQLALRILKLPYVAINSAYGVSEAVGPLPCLQDLKASVMVGRRESGKYCSSVIIEYLEKSQKFPQDWTLDSCTKEQQVHSVALQTMIQEKMTSCLTVLQYADEEIWQQITRPRCNMAGGNLTVWQTRSERIYELNRLSHEYREMSSETAITCIKDCYRVFEVILEEKKNGYLIGTSTPSLVDALLWDHLMNALTDAYLSSVLVDYPCLLQYVQQIWDKYFVGDKKKLDWEEWNTKENSRNAFCNIPSLMQKNNEAKSFRHAIDLMEYLSERDRNLKESLENAQETRGMQISKRRRAPFETWHRWRLGGTLYPSTPPKAAKTEQEEKTQEDYKRNDELWMATVFVATSFGLLTGFLGRAGE